MARKDTMKEVNKGTSRKEKDVKLGLVKKNQERVKRK